MKKSKRNKGAHPPEKNPPVEKREEKVETSPKKGKFSLIILHGNVWDIG